MVKRYMEVELHGDTGARDHPNLGEGDRGFIEKLNAYAELGWEVLDLDRDTTVHVRAILVRDVPDRGTKEREAWDESERRRRLAAAAAGK